MKIETREMVLDRIKKYLIRNPSEMKGVRSFGGNRVKAVIKRLDEYSPIETIKWNLPERKLYREVALAAGIHFVRQYPMLYHTPNSLRACFGVPTRTDRKKGRFSSIFYRNEAVERQLRPQTSDLDLLRTQINRTKGSNFSNEIDLLNEYIEKAKRRKYAEEIIETPESDHSPENIKNLMLYLTNFGFLNLYEASELNQANEKQLEDLNGVLLAPDLIGTLGERECWIELKEYRELKFNSKVLFQIFRYLYQISFVVLITISPLRSFVQLLEKKQWSVNDLREWALLHYKKIQDDLQSWIKIRKTFYDLGKILNLNARLEAIYISLTNEIVTREIGLAGTELNGMEKFLEILGKFENEIIIADFNDFISQKTEVPKNNPLLLLNMNYSTNSKNI